MDVKTLIKTARDSAEKLKAAAPSLAAEKDIELAVAVDAKGKSFVGVTGFTVKKSGAERIAADYNAVINMVNEGSRIAANIAVIKVADGSVVKPSAECLDLLFRTNVENDNCNAVVSDSETKTVSSLRLGGSGADLLDGFDFGGDDAEPAEKEETAAEQPAAEEPAPEPAAPPEPKSTAPSPEHSSNVISGVKVDESNPFYEAPTDVKPPEEVLASISGENLEAQAIEKEAEEELPELSKEELLKQAKKRKKVAKANFLFRKRH